MIISFRCKLHDNALELMDTADMNAFFIRSGILGVIELSVAWKFMFECPLRGDNMACPAYWTYEVVSA